MSNSTPVFQEIISQDQLWVIKNYSLVSSSILWIIDFFQTLPMEIDSVWLNKMNGTAIIFLVNRYVFALYLILGLAYGVPGSASDKSCNILRELFSTLQNITPITTSLLFTLRVYAICDKNKLVLGIASTLILTRLGLDIWQVTPRMSVGVSSMGTPFKAFSMCATSINDPSGYETSALVTVILPVAFDAFVFAVTVFKVYRHALEMRKFGQISVTKILLRDGEDITLITVFIVLVLAMAELALTLDLSQASTSLETMMQGYNFILPNLLVNHLYLNIRAFNRSHFTEHNDLPQHSFARNRFLGNIGAPLDPDWWDAQFDEDDEELDSEGQLEVNQDGLNTVEGGNGLSTLVPVVYDTDGTGDIEMIPIQRE
ncbi:uncharacterized protein STEHIDRAFT_113570 [Stereum hirsutum FP-91666 SS1]|uniref:uncharacterized protein n=1 Tax=Stereum hirsutum (strain FP-91666) TaxID=721885 RepID=UPI000444A0D0|nr:uncharacterized protein STEHIDRAFT_113570 [Stereum hirsutum FP-91666 SS1]EIM83441.1 hypothetical protein STEHIDRAFT_113570 [Stereum hirsutum FP-91666 SS1]